MLPPDKLENGSTLADHAGSVERGGEGVGEIAASKSTLFHRILTFDHGSAAAVVREADARKFTRQVLRNLIVQPAKEGSSVTNQFAISSHR